MSWPQQAVCAYTAPVFKVDSLALHVRSISLFIKCINNSEIGECIDDVDNVYFCAF